MSLHKIGNKTNDEGCFFSAKNFAITADLQEILNDYFLGPFTSEEYFQFFHDADLSLNEVFTYASKIFEDLDSLHEQSINLGKHLYNQSIHPKVKGGEFYVVYFKNGNLKGETVDIIGLFKSENKDIFLNVFPNGEDLEMDNQEGININKLDKGCLIYNSDKENGYVVSVIDKTNKGNDAQYWVDYFLNVRQMQDAYFNTENTLSLYKKFIVQQLPQEFEISKADQADLLNKSIGYFKENEQFETEEFNQSIFEQPEVISSFKNFKETYKKEREIEIGDSFDISESAVKKQNRSYKSIIKLDKNFHIYIHGGRHLIEQGVDEEGKKFYKIFYENEV